MRIRVNSQLGSCGFQLLKASSYGGRERISSRHTNDRQWKVSSCVIYEFKAYLTVMRFENRSCELSLFLLARIVAARVARSVAEGGDVNLDWALDVVVEVAVDDMIEELSGQADCKVWWLGVPMKICGSKKREMVEGWGWKGR